MATRLSPSVPGISSAVSREECSKAFPSLHEIFPSLETEELKEHNQTLCSPEEILSQESEDSSTFWESLVQNVENPAAELEKWADAIVSSKRNEEGQVDETAKSQILNLLQNAL